MSGDPQLNYAVPCRDPISVVRVLNHHNGGTLMIVNLPKMLHEALLRGQTGSKKAMEHARVISSKAKASGAIDENLAAIRAFQMATEVQASYAAGVAHIMAAVSSHQNQGIDDLDDDCGNDSCPVHGNKPN